MGAKKLSEKPQVKPLSEVIQMENPPIKVSFFKTVVKFVAKGVEAFLAAPKMYRSVDPHQLPKEFNPIEEKFKNGYM